MYDAIVQPELQTNSIYGFDVTFIYLKKRRVKIIFILWKQIIAFAILYSNPQNI